MADLKHSVSMTPADSDILRKWSAEKYARHEAEMKKSGGGLGGSGGGSGGGGGGVGGVGSRRDGL